MEFIMKAGCVMSAQERQVVAGLDQLSRTKSQGQPMLTNPFTAEQLRTINQLYEVYIQGKLMGTQGKDLAGMILEEEASGQFTPVLCGQQVEKARLMLLQWLTSFPERMDEHTAAKTFLSALTNRTPARYLCFGAYQHNQYKI